jgi:outer membrane usher protein
VDGDGKPLPVGSVAVLDATHAEAPVGFGGQTYVEHLAPHNTVTVKLESEKTCTVAFAYARLSGDIPTIGPLTCQEKKP